MAKSKWDNWDWMYALDLADEKDPDDSRLRLYPLQLANCERLAQNDAVYIFDEVGIGKTVTAGLMALHYLMNNYTDLEKKVLVITTPPLARGGWQGRYLLDWQELLPFKELCLINRIHIINNNCANIHHVGEYGLVIIDEAHNFLNADTERYECLTACYRKKPSELKTEKIVFLTASPIKQGFFDLCQYYQLAKAMLPNGNVSCDWIKNLKEWQKEWQKKCQPVCARFGLNVPVTRYFKDTMDALEDKASARAKRLPPDMWYWGAARSKQETLLRALRAAIKADREKYNIESRFLIFVKYVNDIDDSKKAKDYKGAKDLREYLIGRKEALSSHKEPLSCDNELLKCSYEYPLEFFEENEVAVVTGQYRCDPTFDNVYEHGCTALSMYGKKGEDAGKLPRILIVTYPIAGEGVNLPGFNYVVNYHIPSYPAALEQRLGRIDRDKSTFPEIHACYLLWDKGLDTNTINFHHAVDVCISGLLPYLPTKSTMLSKDVLELHFSAGDTFQHLDQIIRELLDDETKLLAAFQAYQHHCNNSGEQEGRANTPKLENAPEEQFEMLIEFCDEYLGFALYANAKEFRSAVISMLSELKREAGFNVSPELRELYFKKMLSPEGDKDIAYVKNVDELEKKGPLSADIEYTSGSKCAEQICEDECFKWFCEGRTRGSSQQPDQHKIELYQKELSRYLISRVINVRCSPDYSPKKMGEIYCLCEAAQNNPIALYCLGVLYEEGYGTKSLSNKYFEQAAGLEYVPAQYKYGCCLKELDPNRIYLWTKAAEQGYVPAQVTLAKHYNYKKPDLEKAIMYYELAACDDNFGLRWEIMCELAHCYEQRGTEGDHQKAFDRYMDIIENLHNKLKHRYYRQYQGKCLTTDGAELFQKVTLYEYPDQDWAFFELNRLFRETERETADIIIPISGLCSSCEKYEENSIKALRKLFKAGFGTRENLELFNSVCKKCKKNQIHLGRQEN